MDIETLEIPCPECGYEGPHNPIDDSAVECGSCYTPIDIRDVVDDAS
jgi:hypothetical protein